MRMMRCPQASTSVRSFNGHSLGNGQGGANALGEQSKAEAFGNDSLHFGLSRRPIEILSPCVLPGMTATLHR